MLQVRVEPGELQLPPFGALNLVGGLQFDKNKDSTQIEIVLLRVDVEPT